MAQPDWRNLLDRYLYDIAVALQPVIDDISMKLKSNLAACEYAEIDGVPNKMKKVEKLVNSVRSRDLATFNKFCEILEGCGHKKLAQKLQGRESTLTGEQAYNILRKNYVRLQEALPVNDILPELFAKAVVTDHEFLTLQNEFNEVKQRRQLATYLLTAVRRRESNFQTLCDVLLKTVKVEDLGRALIADAHSKPSMKKLLPFVVLVAPNWYELGVMLLKEEQEPQLKTIKSEYGNDVRKCCLAMLEYWMDTHPEATWYHLTTALKSPGVDLAAVASEVEKNFTADHIRPTVESSISVDFADFKNVVDAFTTLMRIFTEELSCANFITIRTICLTRASKRLQNEICRTTNIHDLFTLLVCNPFYFNWMNVEYLRTMAIAAGSTRLLDILKNYTDVVLSKTLGEVWGFVPSFHKAKVKYYSEVKARFHGMNPDNITVKELKKYEPRFAKKIALHIMRVEKGSLTITWCILAEEAYHGYQLALNIPQESRQDTFLQIGKWVVFHPQSVLQELKKAHAMITTAALLIGYYHGLLMRNINVDLLADKMCSVRLLTTHESNIISFGNSIHHRNWMLLEQVRHFDVHALIIFCELVQEIWPQIGSQLFTALKHQETAEVNQVEKADNIESVVPKVHVYYEIQSLHILFLYLIDQVSEILLSYKMELFPQCKNLKASDIHSINLFSAHQIDELSGFNTPSILVVLSPLFTWSNHSILRALVSCCGKAIKLLDEFDSKMDPLQPVTSFPIPCLYCDMIPSDTSTYTILGIRCKIELYESSLQYVYDVQSLMVEKCGITQHCLQLLAVRSNPTIFYWTIPKHVVYLIDANVPQHNEYLYSQGIFEVMVYPDLILITGDDICLGSLTFLCENQMFGGEIEDVAVTNQIRKLSTETLLKHVCSERDSLFTELQHNKSYTTALEETLRKKDNTDLKHDQGVHSVQTMVTEATDDGKENKEPLQDWLKKITMDNFEKQKHIESLHTELEEMKVEIKQLHEYINENDASIKIQQLQKQNKELHQLVNKSRKFKHLETVSKAISPDYTKCEVQISAAIVNQETTLIITLKDKDGNLLPDTMEELHVYVEATNVGIMVKPIKEIGNGKYEASFTVSNYEDHMISILVGGYHIPGSPIKTSVTLRDYSKMAETDCNQIVTHYGKSCTKYGNLRDIALGPNNETIIVDNSNQCVIVLDCKLNLLRVIGKGIGLGTLTDPCCVAVSNEVIAISDQQCSHQVKKYTLQGEFISAIGHHGTKIGEFDYPRGLVFNNSNLYVVDGFNYRVQVFHGDDKFAFSFGSEGVGPGEFTFPVRIANNSAHDVLVSDNDNNCITQFTYNGQFVRSINCIAPWAITVTLDKYLITSHQKENEPYQIICIWDPSYELINIFGTREILPENYVDIRGIKMDCNGNIFMVDHDKQQINIFYK